ncbi:GNAT family N-acetyltransferase [Chitinophaga nivalis]|uniref:GNAT family N-acetyltransferase n=1 Tax=Chitinophaga nivalis TaxID=2991709 RepID=A0ABT3IIN5_9BACT|nr:GNAT family N-acetyltransferase [Chitinophaga nivalis]MCW3466479.1 GNAT family N-acetyltransferase [Chitinophaga nivalis]MCW3483830.1 GNAT family N-acetyltransferase [Chitinophaga nivalis]
MDLPILSTGELILRPMEERDTASLFRHFSDENVTRFMDIDVFTNISDAVQMINYFKERLERGEGMRWAITLAGQDELIGTCGFHNCNKTHFKAEIGYDLQPHYWGNGIMTAAVSAMLDYGYETLQYNRIEAFVDPINTSSSKLLTKLGFSYEGMLRDAFFEKGKFVDAELYSRLRRDHTRENIN